MNSFIKRARVYGSMVKFSHTIFAMPFALYGFFMGLVKNEFRFEALVFVLILLCMVFARNAAMAFNRYADKRFDELNPRTSGRELPAGTIKPGAALVFVIINSVLFIIAAGFINTLTLILSPVALAVILGYSLTKRFTAYSHIFLGLALGLAPVGAYISVTGYFSLIPVLTGLQVLAWVGGFDIIYSLQDTDFDRDNKLHSIPSRFGRKGARVFSGLLHLVSFIIAFTAGLISGSGLFYYIGTIIFGLLLTWEQYIARPGDTKSINMAFATINSYAGVVFVAFAIADLLIA
ncbi:MAG: UbiA-like polyprenyltransferase [Marinilabiliaceae bacterium]|jgi:4-hydroxybenzoate polyprenyltransferase|nr:UbiA-like polyprenyltransferase [Marinilabiliaceae bacterium]